MRCVLLGLFVLSCGSPPRIKAERWDSAPPAPPVALPKPEPTMTMRRAPAPRAIADRIADRVAAKLQASKPSPYPSGACPADLSLAVTRPIDGRRPGETIKARYAKQHQQLVRRSELVEPTDAITRILALEREQPVVVPAGFRSEIVARGRDAGFRLHMARCELAERTTVRRAGYDAAIAFLLGAPAAEVLPIVRDSLYPDGTLSQSCRSSSDCGGNTLCDSVSKTCMSPRAKAAAFLSAPELEIEDLLVRAFGTKITMEQLERERYVADDLVTTWLFGRYTRCDGALCNITRADVKGKTRLIHRDRRDRGDSTPSRDPEPWEICHAETGSTTRGLCTAKCEGDRGTKERAACVATCTTLCPIEHRDSPGTDGD